MPVEKHGLRKTLTKEWRGCRFKHCSLCSYRVYLQHGGVLCKWRQRRHCTFCNSRGFGTGRF